jgi:hypothetical protein
VALTRLFSLITWYHLAFFTVSIALLGMTAGATTVYLKQDWFTDRRLYTNIGKAIDVLAVIFNSSFFIFYSVLFFRNCHYCHFDEI